MIADAIEGNMIEFLFLKTFFFFFLRKTAPVSAWIVKNELKWGNVGVGTADR